MTETLKPINTKEDELIKKEKKRQYIREYMKKRKETDPEFLQKTRDNVLKSLHKMYHNTENTDYKEKVNSKSRETYRKMREAYLQVQVSV